MGLLCAEQNVRNLKQMHFQKLWDFCAQNKTSEISKIHVHVSLDSGSQNKTSEISKDVNFVLGLNKAHVLALNTAHVLRLNKADVLALNKAHVLRLNTKIGGWGVSPTGKSVRFVRACDAKLRVRARR